MQHAADRCVEFGAIGGPGWDGCADGGDVAVIKDRAGWCRGGDDKKRRGSSGRRACARGRGLPGQRHARAAVGSLGQTGPRLNQGTAPQNPGRRRRGQRSRKEIRRERSHVSGAGPDARIGTLQRHED